MFLTQEQTLIFLMVFGDLRVPATLLLVDLTDVLLVLDLAAFVFGVVLSLAAPSSLGLATFSFALATLALALATLVLALATVGLKLASAVDFLALYRLLVSFFNGAFCTPFKYNALLRNEDLSRGSMSK